MNFSGITNSVFSSESRNGGFAEEPFLFSFVPTESNNPMLNLHLAASSLVSEPACFTYGLNLNATPLPL